MMKVPCTLVLFAASACAVDTMDSEPLIFEEGDVEVDETEIEALDISQLDGAVQVIGPDGSVQVLVPDTTPPSTESLDDGGVSGAIPPSVAGPNTASEAFPPGAGIGATTGTQTGSGTTPPSVGGPNTAAEAFPPGAGIGATTGTQTGSGTTPPSVGGPSTASDAFPNIVPDNGGFNR